MGVAIRFCVWFANQNHLPNQEPHIIGLDDWAWKRGLRYGTLICDLEQGVPIDLLPDRTVATVSAWLQKHPTIEIVSRDGSSGICLSDESMVLHKLGR